jgi:hypothetical protein
MFRPYSKARRLLKNLNINKETNKRETHTEYVKQNNPSCITKSVNRPIAHIYILKAGNLPIRGTGKGNLSTIEQNRFHT